MQCDICGKEVKNLTEVDVEGTILSLCDDCKKFGKPIKKPKRIVRSRKRYDTEEEDKPIEMIRPDYSSVLKSARQKKGLKQEDVAKKLNEKESMIHSLETGHHEPSLDLARKLENFYGVKVIETVDKEEKEKKSKAKSKSSGLTIGDIIKVKKK
jgi:putative transcription factor